MGMTGRTAIVTGATSGIGEATAEHFAALGAKVVVAGRDAERGQAVVDRIRAHGGEAIFVAHDLSDPEGAKALVAAAEAQYGVIDIVVANAGTFFFGPLPAVTLDEFDTAMRINVRGTYLLAQAALPAMTKSDAGRFVLMGTSGASHGVAMASLYCMSKGALKGLMAALVPEYGPAGITVNLIEPGLVETPLTAPMTGTAEARAPFIPHQPTGRIGVPMDIAHTAAMLADELAGHISGQTIVVDGGNTRTAKHSVLPPPPDKL
ncbi:unannotated protein [freshwater metagenome]|uniref:Unannotated protein n=1 Tax=freshwater metagenome TaxID=449393 RepID=A0A6J7J6A7_9ZZZZ|nr:glucose 1-dehydrogenase [Actinomycetota bacterium]